MNALTDAVLTASPAARGGRAAEVHGVEDLGAKTAHHGVEDRADCSPCGLRLGPGGKKEGVLHEGPTETAVPACLSAFFTEKATLHLSSSKCFSRSY